MNAKFIWPFVYLAVGFSAALGGAESVRPSYTAKTNVDWVLVSFCFAVALSIPSIAVSASKSQRPLPAPSFSRFLRGSWQKDPLQCLLITAVFLGGSAIGSGIGLAWPHTNQGTMFSILYLAMFIGLVIGAALIRGKVNGA